MKSALYRLSYQRACVIAAVLLPAFGVLYNALYPAATDPLWVRLVLSGLILLVLWLSRVSGFVQQHLVRIVRGALYFLTGWLTIVTAANAFAPGYAVGLVFTIAAIGTVFGIGVERVAPLVYYFGAALAGVVGAARWVTAPEVHVALLALIVIGMGIATVVAAAARLHAEQQMQAAQRELERARAQAEKTLRLRTSMLNNMSHELRTPLTAILGFAETLAEEVPSPQCEFADIIVQSARRLKGTIDSVLDLAQIDSGSLNLDLEALDLYEEAQAVARLLRPQAEKGGLFLKVHSEAPGRALLDRRCLSRVLNNLVGNAIKFTEHGGVTLIVRAEAGAACVRVEDTGIGISKAFLPHLFDEFRQQSSGLARTYEGNGLGLNITHRLVTLMGGQIRVESKQGVGSVFTLRFPTVAERTELPAETNLTAGNQAAPGMAKTPRGGRPAHLASAHAAR